MKYICIINLFLLFIFSSLWAEDQVLPEEVFKKRSALYHENGTLKRCKLKETLVVQGYPCERWLWFHDSGAIAQFQLSKTRMIQNITFPGHSTVFLHPNGSLRSCYFSKDITVQGLPLNGGYMKVMTSFDGNGRITFCCLSKDTKIRGIPCKANVFKPVYLYSSGAVRKRTLSMAHTIDGKEYKKGTTLEFETDGSLKSTQSER
jgi:hypothetical protein